MKLTKLEFWLGQLHPTWSLTECRARVVDVIVETADTRTFVLAPNRRWAGHRPGQYVPVEVELDGVRTRRCYSISNHGDGWIAITVQRVPGGQLSNHLHDHVGVGAVVVLGAAAGDFTLPAATPRKLLLVAGGSGVTPIIALARDLAARATATSGALDVVIVHAARTDADAICARDLGALAASHPGVRLIAHRGLVTRDVLDSIDHGDRDVYVCGPAGLIDLVEATCARVRHERFVAPPRATPTTGAVLVTVDGRDVAVDGRGPLLEQLERAGERPRHGCRMGICGSCRCHKLAGTSIDLVTGARSTTAGDIKLCVTAAGSDLQLERIA